MTGFRCGHRTGDRIVFGSWRGGRFSNLYLLDLETGSTERLTDSPDMQLPTSITPDGTTRDLPQFHARVCRRCGWTRAATPITLVETPGRRAQRRALSRRTLAGVRGESASRPGQLDVYVRPFPDVDRGLWQVTRDGGTYPVWARNGRELFYIDARRDDGRRAGRGVGHRLEGRESDRAVPGPIHHPGRQSRTPVRCRSRWPIL